MNGLPPQQLGNLEQQQIFHSFPVMAVCTRSPVGASVP